MSRAFASLYTDISARLPVIDVSNNDKINITNRACQQRPIQRERLHVSLLIFPVHHDYRYLLVLSNVIEFSRALTRAFWAARKMLCDAYD